MQQRVSGLLALAATLSSVSAGAIQGFNYGSTFTDGSNKQQSDFQSEFNTAKNLVGNSGFTSARLYTTIQGGTTNTPISAIPAAVAEGTHLLLGIWASAGQTIIDNEIAALKSAISTYGTSFTDLVDGISVGSEDLYRISPTGIAAKSGAGASPSDVANFIGQVKSAIAGTSLSSAPVGHVDTWTAWVNGSNQAVIDASDFIGMDAYPYFQNTMSNSIDAGKSLFFDALDQTKAAVGGKSVWVTETGFPVSGPTENLAVPSIENAQTYWDQVGCALFGSVNTYWYTLQDAAPTTPAPSFGLVGSTLTTTPLYNLSCDAVASSSSSAASTATSAASASGGASSAAATSSAPEQTAGSPGLGGVASAASTAETAEATATGSASGSSSSGSSSSNSTGTGSSGSGSNVTVATTIGTPTQTASSSSASGTGATGFNAGSKANVVSVGAFIGAAAAVIVAAL